MRRLTMYLYSYGDEFPNELHVSVCHVDCLTSPSLYVKQMLIQTSYFVIGHLARNDAEIIRLAGLLRGTESAAQAVSVQTTCALFSLP